MTTENPEIKVLLMKVESRFGQIRTSVDYQHLSEDIEKNTSEIISESTLKRLWGYVAYDSKPRMSSLDVLSRYVGYPTFSDFCESVHGDPQFVSGFLTSIRILSDELVPGEKIIIGWNPDRIVELTYYGNNRYVVQSSENASLRPGDSFTMQIFVKGFPMYIPHIIRNGRETPLYVAGYKDGLTIVRKV